MRSYCVTELKGHDDGSRRQACGDDLLGSCNHFHYIFDEIASNSIGNSFVFELFWVR